MNNTETASTASTVNVLSSSYGTSFLWVRYQNVMIVHGD